MRLAKIADRVAGLGSDKWAVHVEGKQRRSRGEELIFLSIGEPDLAPPHAILDVAAKQMMSGRTKYSAGNGEQNMLDALARFYTKQTGRKITSDQFIFLPGTQTALAVAFLSIVDPGDEVILFDPYYATYEAVVAAPGGIVVPVKLDPDTGFHPNIALLERAITKKTRAILLNTPSNPTGAVFTEAEVKAIGAVAKKHDLWIVSDEVYATQVHGDHVFTSPFFDKALEERVIVCSSISKSHALPGFRCGWIAGSAEFCARITTVSETLLFGSQPFLEDATAFALTHEFEETEKMRQLYVARGQALIEGLRGSNKVSARMPEGGMFLMVDVRKTGLSGEEFAFRLLREKQVVTMPGESFGTGGAGHLRVALTVDEAEIRQAAERIAALAAEI
ncbi:pyridoxal phosphate-dependent aminotransferase [Aestuariivirga litoralis]|uniref:pyridoxal phosphate-dependent aminotransferase n=1 Tax=Aestuariivirga litoralis TaxID=2650924 RepID=UPI0018C7ED65|nr:pyridoxal phosphate-dependent aminotransferase [Aestuariivirga litoralis]MBG1232829.1 pyridoxal phosphate-dependent aminotransferase [Aestuariivirga litoralis]